MASKQNDLMLNILANPQFSIGDFLKVGLSANNTSLENEDTYLKSDLITSNPLFLNESGEFDKVKFHNIYLQAAKGLEQMANEPLNFQAVYSKYNIWAPVNQRETSPGFELVKISNPDRITKSMLRIGQDGPREFTPLEIAQSQKVWDSEKLEWMDTPEDMFSFKKLFSDFTGFFSDNFNATKVMATYDEDIDVNGKRRGEVGFDENLIEHQKGDYMLNDNGTYYYRTLKDGENIYGKLVLHYSDILTKEGSALNAIDFLDSDDIHKSGFGSFVKNASLIGAMFIPGGIGTAIAGATIFLQAAGLGATLGKIALGGNNSSMNWLEGLSESTNPLNTRSEWSSIDYGNTGRNTTWTIENLLGMVGDVVGLLKLQRLLFEYSPTLLKGKWGMNEKNRLLLKELYYNELSQASKGKILSKLEKDNPLKAIEASTKLLAENMRRAADMVEDYMKSYQKTGEELSKAYMTMLTVNDIYGEAKEAGADDFDAALVTAGYAAMEYALLSTDIGKWVLPELRGQRLQNKAMVRALTKDVRDSFSKLRRAATESDEAKRTYLLKLVDFGKSVAKGEFNVGLGKRAAFKEGTGLMKAGIGSLLAGASAEAVEETSEELLADFSRVLFNGLELFKGKDVRLKPFENAFDRYAMSFLGGFIGGGVSSATFDFRNARRAVNMSYNEAMLELIHKAHNNDLDGIYKILDKEEIGNKNLSAKNFDKDENGNVIWKQGDENDNQDLAIKDLVRRQLNLITNTLNAHGGKTDDELIDAQTMKDLRFRALRNTTTAGLFILKYNELLTELVNKTLELNNLNTPVTKSENGESDESVENKDVETQRKTLENEIKDIDKKLEEFNSGAKAPLFMATALIESTPFIAKALMNATFKVYAENESGKKFENISEEELKELETKYQNYLKTDKKDDLLLATKAYLAMLNIIGDNLKLAQDVIKKQAEDPMINKLLLDTSTIFEGLNFQTDENKWLENFGKWAEGNQALSEGIISQVNLFYNTYRENLANNQKIVDDAKAENNNKKQQVIDAVAAQKQLQIKNLEDKFNLGELAGGIDEETKNNSIAQLDVWEREEILKLTDKLELIDINALEKEKNIADDNSKKDLDRALQDLIFKTGVKLSIDLADRVLAQGFINGAIKNQVIDKLVGMSRTLEQSYTKAKDLFLKELVRKGLDKQEVDAFVQFVESGNIEDAKDVLNGYGFAKILNPEQELLNYLDLNSKYLDSKEELDLKIEQIKNLKYTPVILNLDAFALGIGKGKISLLLDTLGKILSTSRQNVSTFNISGDLYKLLGEAERVLDLYMAALEGSRVDTVDPFRVEVGLDGNPIDKSNVWGINRVINEVHAKSPKVEGENWKDLPEIEGEAADMMLEDLKRLKDTLHSYKQLYSINQGLKLNVLKRVSTKTNYLLYRKAISLITNVDLPDKEKLETTLNSLTLLKEQTSKPISDWTVNLNKDQEKLLEKEIIQMEDAIFEYFLDKVDNIDTLKKIFNPKNFVMYNDQATLLTEGSEDLDDTSFIGYLAIKAAIKTSSFLNGFKEILKNGNIAPLKGQEISVQLGLANKLNGKVISNIITAYRSSLLEMSVEERKEFLRKAGKDEATIKAYSTESGIKLFINDDLVPQYDNIVFIDGIPGAGKSAAVDALIYKYLKAYHPEIVNNNKLWISHGGDTEGGKISKKFSTDIGLDEEFENAFDKEQLLKQIFPDYTTPKLNDKGRYEHKSEDYIIDNNGKIQPTWEIDGKWNKDNVPELIFIDEAQQYTQLELLALDKFAKKFGIAIITSGDLNQSQIEADVIIESTLKEINKEAGEKLFDDEREPLHIHLTRNQVLHVFKLGTSMRTSNNLKNINMGTTEVIMSKGKGELLLHYYEDDQVLSGDLLLETLNLDEITPYIDKMIPLLKEGEKIHFASDKNDTIRKELEKIEKYNKIIEFHEGVALGQEGDYWIIKFNDVNKDSFMLDFYTGLTRSRLFSLMLSPSTVANGKIKIFNIKDGETHKEEYSPAAVKKYSDDYVALLTEVLPDNAGNIPYNPRDSKEETPVELKNKNYVRPNTALSKKLRAERKRAFLEYIEGKLPLENNPESGEEINKDADYYIQQMIKAKTHKEVDNIYAEALLSGIDEQEVFPTYSLRHYEIDDASNPSDDEGNYDDTEDLFNEDDEVTPDEISPIEDLTEEEAKEQLDSDSGVQVDDSLNAPIVNTRFSIKGFRYILFSNATFEIGTLKVDRANNTYEIDESFYGGVDEEGLPIRYRIDGVNGIENPLIRDSEWKKIRETKNLAEAERKLGYIRKLLMSNVLDKSLITQLISSDLGLVGNTYIRFAVKTSSLDTNFEKEQFLKLEKSPNESTPYARAQESELSLSNYVNNRSLVAIIGTEENGDIIEIPLLTLNNPITLIRALDKEDSLREVFDITFRDTSGDYGTKQIAGLKAVLNVINGDLKYTGLEDLIRLYLATYRHILFIPGVNWTPGKNLKGLGVLLNFLKGLLIYDDRDYVLTKEYVTLDELRKDPTLQRITAPMLLTNKDGKIVNPENENQIIKIANPKHPFVLYTDQIYDHNGKRMYTDLDLIDEFLWLQFNNVPKTVELVYILPPKFTLREYLRGLVDFMVNKGPAPYGNQRTAYKILETLLLIDPDATLLCFKNALGDEDGQILYNKTASVVAELLLITKNGESDAKRQAQILTSRRESWTLGNVGIPKEIPLYRQLQNVLKLLVHPQSVVMEETDDGFLIYVSRRGIDKFDELIGPLEEIFNKSGVALYHQVKGSKTNRGLFTKIQVDENGHFPTGLDFTINGNTSSSAFETNELFNNVIHNLVKQIDYTEASEGQGIIIKTPDNVMYVYHNYSGFNPFNRGRKNVNVDAEEVVPSMHPNIINKLKSIGYSDETISEIQNQLQHLIKVPNDLNLQLLQTLATSINNTGTSVKAVVVDGKLLFGQSNFFKNKDVTFGLVVQTTRGKEVSVFVDGVLYDGVFFNGELILLGLEEKQNRPQRSTNTVDENNLENTIDLMLGNMAAWSILSENAKNKLIGLFDDYQRNKTPENARIILKNRNFKKLLENFEKPSSDDTIQPEEEQRMCSTEIKIKFN